MQICHRIWTKWANYVVILAVALILLGCRAAVVEMATVQPTILPTYTQAAASTVATKTLKDKNFKVSGDVLGRSYHIMWAP